MKRASIIRTCISLVPIAVLVILLALNISFFGSDAILGASQVSLLFSAGLCVWLAMWLFGKPWDDFEAAIRSNIGDVTTAIVILFMIGGISGTWTDGARYTLDGRATQATTRGVYVQRGKKVAVE